MPRGGKQPGAGRPHALARTTREAVQLERQLRDKVIPTLVKLADNYEKLVDVATKMALNGDDKMLRLLIELPFKLLNLQDSTQSKFDQLRRKWTYEETAPAVADEREQGKRPPIDVGHQTLP